MVGLPCRVVGIFSASWFAVFVVNKLVVELGVYICFGLRWRLLVGVVTLRSNCVSDGCFRGFVLCGFWVLHGAMWWGLPVLLCWTWYMI